MAVDATIWNEKRRLFLSEWDRTKYHELFDDFNDIQTETNWVETKVNTGTDLVYADDQDGGEDVFGVGAFILDTADNDNYLYHWGTAVAGDQMNHFNLSSAKKFYFGAKVKIEDVSADLALVGCTLVNTDPWNALPTDGMWFDIEVGIIELNVSLSLTEITKVVVSPLAVDNVYVTLELLYDGAGMVGYWKDREFKGRVDVSATFPNAAIGPVFGCEATDTGTDEFFIDWIHARIER